MTDPLKPYFLPYQIAWLNDVGRRKIWEKSRRIGATYVQSYEDVRDCVKAPGLPVWFSSADESAAKEYILYCEQWAKIFKAAGKILSVDEEILDEKKGVKALVIKFANGSRIHGLSSNPTAFRSKGGKTMLDIPTPPRLLSEATTTKSGKSSTLWMKSMKKGSPTP